MSTGPGIESNPGVRSGKPCFVGTRITVKDVSEYLASGMSSEEVVDHFPELTADHVRLALALQHEASAHAPVGSGLDLVPVWQDVGGRMAAHFAAGRRHLLTEDVLRWATIDALIDQGLAPDDLQVEVIIPTTRGKIDLVVGRGDEAAAVEFKFPRDSRTGISPDTMTLGELLKDVYRLAAVPSFGERWAVMFLNDRLRRYLERRTDCRWTFEVSEELAFSPEGFAQLPQTASRGLGEWAEASVLAVCRVSEVVAGHRLVAYEVGGALDERLSAGSVHRYLGR